MKNQKIKVYWKLQPAHDDSMTFLHDGKMYIKVGPALDEVEIRFGPSGVYSVVDKLNFNSIEDAYSYYNQEWCDRDEEETNRENKKI